MSLWDKILKSANKEMEKAMKKDAADKKAAAERVKGHIDKIREEAEQKIEQDLADKKAAAESVK